VPDVEIAARETLQLTTSLTQILADHTNQTFEKVKADTQRDFFLNGAAAKEYGLIDEVLERPVTVPSSNGSAGLM
jgi:ATP-dependent Clp protease protease subunit